MEGRGWIGRHGFWPLALLWLPAGVVAPPDRGPGQAAAVRFGDASFAEPGALLAALGSLAPVALCGLPLALGCGSLQRLGYRRAAWAAGIGPGVPTVAGTVVAGLLGPAAIAVWAVLLSLPAWIVRWWLARRR